MNDSVARVFFNRSHLRRPLYKKKEKKKKNLERAIASYSPPSALRDGATRLTAIVTVLAFSIDYRYPPLRPAPPPLLHPKESSPRSLTPARGPSLSLAHLPPAISVGLDLALMPDDKGFRR